jgi:hypothetical protein
LETLWLFPSNGTLSRLGKTVAPVLWALTERVGSISPAAAPWVIDDGWQWRKQMVYITIPPQS